MPTTRRPRVLIAGSGAHELTALRDVAASVVAHDSHLLALDVPRGSRDPALAWGTEQVKLHRLTHVPDGALGPAVEQPLSEDGDVWKAILDAARHHDADIVVVASVRQSWFRRVWLGSAMHDMLALADLPVLAVPERILTATATAGSADAG